MEPYSRRVTRDERRHGKRMFRSGEEKKREDEEKHEESERREVAIYASGSSSSEGTTLYDKCTIFSKHMVKRSKICARCMLNAVEEFLAIFLRVRGRLIAATAEINERKRKKKRERERERERVKPSRQISTTRVGRIAKKHPNELDHVKIKSDAFSKGSRHAPVRESIATFERGRVSAGHALRRKEERREKKEDVKNSRETRAASLVRSSLIESQHDGSYRAFRERCSQSGEVKAQKVTVEAEESDGRTGEKSGRSFLCKVRIERRIHSSPSAAPLSVPPCTFSRPAEVSLGVFHSTTSTFAQPSFEHGALLLGARVKGSRYHGALGANSRSRI
ncbi:hypothetical protein ALC56_12911 [Trachymyrmex septentrionalis]|uniref:Uncharacterized protein n=1 Tax=Trachymyrmex septentrionalis TaxID=34720 RepID=A0A151JTI1_9HYME|nr:hypothetical protein ALC56_12911 [Trachymyrmex septentrionalis]